MRSNKKILSRFREGTTQHAILKRLMQHRNYVSYKELIIAANFGNPVFTLLLENPVIYKKEAVRLLYTIAKIRQIIGKDSILTNFKKKQYRFVPDKK